MNSTPTNYEIEFNYYFQNMHNFKEKDMRILMATIAGSRLGVEMKLEGYGQCTFDEDDTIRRYGYVRVAESFERKKTNCLVYRLEETPLNHGRYDKLFLYWYAGKLGQHYGFMLHNTKTNRCVQISDTDGDINELLIALSHRFTAFNLADKCEQMLNRT